MRSMSLSVAVAAMAAVAGSAGAQNLLPNGGFENSGPGPIPISNWDVQFNNIFVDDGSEVEAFEGDRSIKAFGFGTEGQNDHGMIEQGIPVTGGEQYRASMHTFNPSFDALGEGNMAFVLLQWRNSGGAQVREDVTTIAESCMPQDTWVQTCASFTAPADATQVDFFLLFIQTAQNPGSVRWDNAVFEQTADACPDLPELCDSGPADCIANLNGDNQLDIDDVLLFLQAFAAGCDFAP